MSTPTQSEPLVKLAKQAAHWAEAAEMADDWQTTMCYAQMSLAYSALLANVIAGPRAIQDALL